MILTHSGHMGDFFPSLIIANYYYKNGGEKTTFILAELFTKFVGLKELLMKQDFTAAVVFDQFVAKKYGYEGDYKFKPTSLTNEKYYNLGIGLPPNDFLGKLYAQEHGLQYDTDININFIDPNFPEELKGQKLYTRYQCNYDRHDAHRYADEFLGKFEAEGYVPFDYTKPLLFNLNLAHYAKDVIMYPNGFSVIADLAGIKFTLLNRSCYSPCFYLSEAHKNC